MHSIMYPATHKQIVNDPEIYIFYVLIHKMNKKKQTEQN